MKLLFKYLRIDFFRAFCSIDFLLSILGVYICMYIGVLEVGGWNISVLYVYDSVVYGMPYLLTIVFCAVPYSRGFYEDIESNFLRLLICRGGNFKCYTIAKCITIIFSSIITMVLGTFCFIIVAKIQLPWVAQNDSLYDVLIAAGGLQHFLNNQNFILYYFLYALQYNILAAILSLFSALISLFLTNKLLILTIPTLTFYIVSFYANSIFDNNIADLYNIFNASVNILNDEVLSYMYAVSIGIICSIILVIIIEQKIFWEVKLNG